MTLESLLRRLGWRGRPAAAASPPVVVELITRADCPLCDEMKAQLARVRTARAFELREVDVLSDPELVQRFALSIPVLRIDGRVAFEGRVTPEALAQALERARAAASRSAREWS